METYIPNVSPILTHKKMLDRYLPVIEACAVLKGYEIACKKADQLIEMLSYIR